MTSDLSQLKIDRSKAPKRRRRGGSPWPVRIAILVALAVVGWLFAGPISAWIDSVRLPEVRVARVTESDPAVVGAVRGAAANGYITAARRAALSADTPGRIVEMLVTEGSVVARGDVVARLFSDDYRAGVERSRAQLDSATSGVASAEARLAAAESEVEARQRDRDAAQADVTDTAAALDFAAKQLDRERELLEGRISSQDDFDAAHERHERALAQHRATEARLLSATSRATDAEHRVEIQRADLEIAKAAVLVAKAQLDEARATLEKTEVTAPFDGIVVLKDAEVGEVVSPNSQGGSNARGSVCTMVDFDSLEAQADVPERNLARVKVDARANIYVDAFPDRTYPGRVDRIWPTADRSKSTVEVRVKFDELDRDLRPDMGVRIVFLDDEQDQPEQQAAGGILIPRDAVVVQGGRSGVFVVERDTLRFVPVTTGAVRGRRVTIEAGLESGQRIVLEPEPSLADGDRVRIAKS